MLYSVLLFGGKAGGGIALGVSSVALGMVCFFLSVFFFCYEGANSVRGWELKDLFFFLGWV